MRHPTLSSGSTCRRRARARIEARVAEMVERGVVAEARAAWHGPLSTTARKVLGLEEFATLPLARGRRGGRRGDAPPRALPAQVAPPASGRALRSRPTAGPEEIADEIRRAGRRRETSTSSLRSRSRPTPSRPRWATPTASSRCAAAARTGSRSRSGTPTARSPRCPATARGSPRAGSPSRPARDRHRPRRRRGRSPRACSRAALSSRTSGRSPSASRRRSTGIRFTPGRRRQPARGRRGRSRASCRASGPRSRRTRASRTARTCRSRGASTPDDDRGARLGARRGGDRLVGHERDRGRRRARRAARARSAFPGGDLPSVSTAVRVLDGDGGAERRRARAVAPHVADAADEAARRRATRSDPEEVEMPIAMRPGRRSRSRRAGTPSPPSSCTRSRATASPARSCAGAPSRRSRSRTRTRSRHGRCGGDRASGACAASRTSCTREVKTRPIATSGRRSWTRGRRAPRQRADRLARQHGRPARGAAHRAASRRTGRARRTARS